MVPRAVKAMYYAVLSPLMRINASRHRAFPVSVRHSRRAHLGPGQKNYLVDWVNVDANLISSRPDVWADLRFKLPFADDSLEAVYSHHVIEHLPDLDAHFVDMFRCLRSGGLIRVGGPHGDNAMTAMKAQRLDWFGDWPKNRSSAGGRFENFIFCSGEHLTILTESFLRELCHQAGFVDIKVVQPKETSYPQTFDKALLETEPLSEPELPHTLLVEARKP